MASSFEYTLGETLLKIEDVSLQYDDKLILSHVNAEVRDIERPGMNQGQVVGFLGPSGIGKTQLFRIIAGLNQPTSGRVVLNHDNHTVRAGQVGVVAQSYPLFEHRTVLGNLMIAAVKKIANRQQAQEQCVDLLNQFGLLDKAGLFPSQLSGGQRQRLAILQQLLCSEHFLLMDEPFSGLDLVTLEKVSELILQVSQMDTLNTVIVVTHDVTAACAVADTLWLMGRDRDKDGNVIPGAHIVTQYNLIERDLCWHPGITTTPRFMDFVREVKDRFRSL